MSISALGNIDEFNNWWEKSKNKKNKSILDDIPTTYPAMLRSFKIQKKVAKIGFDYNSHFEAINKIIEEANELKIELKKNNKKNIKEEMGDLIFSVLDISRKLNLNPEIVLSKTNKKFSKRWKYIEKKLLIKNIDIKKAGINKINQLWQESKNY